MIGALRCHGLRKQGGLVRSLAIYRARPWRLARLARFYAGIVAQGDLAFDIGAHVGNRTRALLRAGARVVAVEPQAIFYAFLRRDLPEGATLLRVAAGPEAGSARLAVSRLHPTVSSLRPDFARRMADMPGFRHVRWDAGEDVVMTTLDALIGSHGVPRFIKIDVEGFEADVLAGLSQPVPWIAFEYLAADTAAARSCVARLGTIGPYRFNFVVGEHDGFASQRWLGPDEIPDAIQRPLAGRSGDVYARLDADGDVRD